jgi:transposase
MAVYAEAKHYENRKRRFLKGLYKAKDEARDIVFIDETGFAPTPWRDYGWGPVGDRVYGEKPSGTRPRTGLIAGLLGSRLVAPLLFDGTCNTELFNLWLRDHLLKTLKAGTVIVLDNAAFHKSRETLHLVQATGCKLLYLPPYSPHLNPIEKRWGTLKQSWKINLNLTLDQLVVSFL